MMEYKGYVARTTISEENQLIFGEVLGLRDVITFEGRTVAEASKAFHESVDLYLETCEEAGITPDRPFSGKMLIRTDPEIHRRLALLAEAAGQSLNAMATKILKRALFQRATLGEAQPAKASKAPRKPSKAKVVSRPAAAASPGSRQKSKASPLAARNRLKAKG